MPALIDVFISFAQEDESLRQDLEKHLTPLKRSGSIRIWDRDQIAPGEERLPALYRRIDVARVVLLLVSPDFIASEYCQNVEMKRIIERWGRREIRVVPVILRPCNWMVHLDGFERLKALPEDGRPVTHWPAPDQALSRVASGVRHIVTMLQAGDVPTPAPRSNRSFISQTAIDAALVDSSPVSALPPLRSSKNPPRSAIPSSASDFSAVEQGPSWVKLLAWTSAMLFLLLVAGGVMVVTGLREGGWLRPPPPDPAPTSGVSPSPDTPSAKRAPLTCAVAPCCGGSECAPGDQNTVGSYCDTAPDHCANCKSGRACVPGACGASLHPRRPFLLRLAGVDMTRGLPPGAEVCVKKAADARAREQCTAVLDAADLRGASSAAGKRTRLPITMGDFLYGKGLDIEVRTDGAPIATRARAAVKEAKVLHSALCVGLVFELEDGGPGRVWFYLDDPEP